MKKNIVVLLSLCFIFLSCSTTNKASEVVKNDLPKISEDGLFEYKEIGGITYSEGRWTREAEIIAYLGKETDLIIPSHIDGNEVIMISGKIVDGNWVGAFQDKSLNSITIPDSVLRIPYNSFKGNPLKSVTLPSNVIISENFWNDPLLTSKTFPEVISFLDIQAFGDLTPYYLANNRKPGMYTKTKLGNGWEYNSNKMKNPAVIIMSAYYTVFTINGTNAEFMNVGDKNPMGITKRYCFIPEGKYSLVIRRETYGNQGWKVISVDKIIPNFEFVEFGVYELITLDDGNVKFELGKKN